MRAPSTSVPGVEENERRRADDCKALHDASALRVIARHVGADQSHPAQSPTHVRVSEHRALHQSAFGAPVRGEIDRESAVLPRGLPRLRRRGPPRWSRSESRLPPGARCWPKGRCRPTQAVAAAHTSRRWRQRREASRTRRGRGRRCDQDTVVCATSAVPASRLPTQSICAAPAMNMPQLVAIKGSAQDA